MHKPFKWLSRILFFINYNLIIFCIIIPYLAHCDLFWNNVGSYKFIVTGWRAPKSHQLEVYQVE